MPTLPNQTQMIFKDNTTLSQTNQNYRFFICPYMLLILLICNMANSSIQGYKRSLPYLRINIILILNTFLTQTFNAIVTSMSSAFIASSIIPLPYWFAFLVDQFMIGSIHISFGLMIAISVCRLLMIVKFDWMIEFEPEKLSQRILGLLLLIHMLFMGYPSFYFITTGFVTPVMSQFTGLKVTYAFDFPLVSISSLAIVSMVTTVGTFNYGRYYLKTHHALSVESERTDTVKNMINMKSIIRTVIVSTLLFFFFSFLQYFDVTWRVPFGFAFAVTIFTTYIVKVVQNPEILAYVMRKFEQKKTNWKESFYALKSQMVKVTSNRVDVQIRASPEP